ncbi:uncharacterized protein LOC136764465 isoform X1 [Amia ocellicauda]|uniref:uncharacterized protein LOC136764465 isoform X1 n=1 Tax=Amia ocellicauda TaxID=2972642 RepID=UPI0034639BFA
MRGLLCVSVAFLSGLCMSLTQSGRQQLKGTVGKSVSLPAPVFQDGFLMFAGTVTIALISKGKSSSDFVDRFRGRVTWDSRTGLFHITQLNTEDSGLYTVDNRGQHISTTVFQLTVYNRVSKPVVTLSAKGSPPDTLCTLKCSVENDAEVTLYWHSLGDTLSSTSSSDLNSILTLPLKITRLSDSYSCVASNPVNLWIASADLEDLCLDKADSLSAGAIAAIVIGTLVGIGIVAGGVTWKCLADKWKEQKAEKIREQAMNLIYLNKAVKDSVTFEASVFNGVLRYNGKDIAEVTSGQCRATHEHFTGRVEFTNNQFCITNLQSADTGDYQVIDGQDTIRGFYLEVHAYLKMGEKESVTFQARVHNGVLTWNGVAIAEMTKGICTARVPRFTGRLEAKDNCFCISNLNSVDRGFYKVKNQDGQKTVTRFHLDIKGVPPQALTRDDGEWAPLLVHHGHCNQSTNQYDFPCKRQKQDASVNAPFRSNYIFFNRFGTIINSMLIFQNF